MATKNGNSDSKSVTTNYDKAVNRATGDDQADGQPTQTSLSNDQKLLFTTPSEFEIDQMLNDPSLEFAPQVAKLEEGQMVLGFLEGNGPPAELTRIDRHTKEETTSIVATWIIAAPNGGARISILSSVQLDKKLPPFVGGMVKIHRGKDVNTSNGNRVTQYTVAGPKKPNGERRSWVVPVVIDAKSLDVKVAPQLAAPTEAQGGESTAS